MSYYWLQQLPSKDDPRFYDTVETQDRGIEKVFNQERWDAQISAIKEARGDSWTTAVEKGWINADGTAKNLPPLAPGYGNLPSGMVWREALPGETPTYHDPDYDADLVADTRRDADWMDTVGPIIAAAVLTGGTVAGLTGAGLLGAGGVTAGTAGAAGSAPLSASEAYAIASGGQAATPFVSSVPAAASLLSPSDAYSIVSGGETTTPFVSSVPPPGLLTPVTPTPTSTTPPVTPPPGSESLFQTLKPWLPTIVGGLTTVAAGLIGGKEQPGPTANYGNATGTGTKIDTGTGTTIGSPPPGGTTTPPPGGTGPTAGTPGGAGYTPYPQTYKPNTPGLYPNLQSQLEASLNPIYGDPNRARWGFANPSQYNPSGSAGAVPTPQRPTVGIQSYGSAAGGTPPAGNYVSPQPAYPGVASMYRPGAATDGILPAQRPPQNRDNGSIGYRNTPLQNAMPTDPNIMMTPQSAAQQPGLLSVNAPAPAPAYNPQGVGAPAGTNTGTDFWGSHNFANASEPWMQAYNSLPPEARVAFLATSRYSGDGTRSRTAATAGTNRVQQALANEWGAGYGSAENQGLLSQVVRASNQGQTGQLSGNTFVYNGQVYTLPTTLAGTWQAPTAWSAPPTG